MLKNEVTMKVKLSFTSKSKKVSSSHNLRQQSIKTHASDQLADNTLHKKHKAQQAVIPLIKHNKWRQPSTKPPPLETEQEEALQLILNETTQDNADDIDPIITVSESNAKNAFGQMLLNKAPGIEDVVDPKKKLQIDCAQRPPEPDNTEYEAMPLSSFGAALLKGMGWNKATPIGNPYGKDTLKLPQSMDIKPRPKNLGLGAMLTKQEADLMVRNKFNPNKQRTESERKRIAEIESWTRDTKPITNGEPPKKKQKLNETKAVKHTKIQWIQNGLKVRCINDNEYFREKGTVIDVMDAYRFSLQMDKDSQLVTLYEDQVDTVIPSKGHFVRILKGKYKNETGCLLTKNKHKQCASVQLQDDLSIVQCCYDDICAI